MYFFPHVLSVLSISIYLSTYLSIHLSILLPLSCVFGILRRAESSCAPVRFLRMYLRLPRVYVRGQRSGSNVLVTPPLILLSPSRSGKQVRRSERERCLLSSGTKTAYRCTYLKTICDRSEASMRYNERSTTRKLNQECEWERKKDCLTCHEN